MPLMVNKMEIQMDKENGCTYLLNVSVCGSNTILDECFSLSCLEYITIFQFESRIRLFQKILRILVNRLKVRSKVPPNDVTHFSCVSGQVFVQRLMLKIISYFFWKSEYAIINVVPNKNYSYTLKPLISMRNALNLGAKVSKNSERGSDVRAHCLLPGGKNSLDIA